MMLSRPVLLGLLWSLLVHCSSCTPQASGQETNKVYSYSYHFQHNGTTNSQDILRTVLGNDPDFGVDPPEGQAIVKTFSSPNIRGFFTRGVLPAGPVSHSGVSSRSALEDIKNIVKQNLQPLKPTGLLTPISPDIGNFNDIGTIPKVPPSNLPFSFQNQPDFPKIPPPEIANDFPRIPPPEIANDFPKIPPPEFSNDFANLPFVNNNGVSRVENFARNTPDGGRVEGKIETFSFNPPPVTNTNSNYQENAEGFRRNENFVNNNQQVNGHRTQSYFRQNFRTITPNSLDGIQKDKVGASDFPRRSRTGGSIFNGNTNSNNQWWNVMNVLGNSNGNTNQNNNNKKLDINTNSGYDTGNTGNIRNNNFNSKPIQHNNNFNVEKVGGNNQISNPVRNQQTNNNNFNTNFQNTVKFNQQVTNNLDKIKNDLNKQINMAFGTRLSSLNRQNVPYNNNNEPNVPKPFLNNNNNQAGLNNNILNRQDNFKHTIANQNRNNQNYNSNIFQNVSPISNQQNTNNLHNNNQLHPNNNNQGYNNGVQNIQMSPILNSNPQSNFNQRFNNDDTTKKVLNLINEVGIQLSNINNNNAEINNQNKNNHNVGGNTHYNSNGKQVHSNNIGTNNPNNNIQNIFGNNLNNNNNNLNRNNANRNIGSNNNIYNSAGRIFHNNNNNRNDRPNTGGNNFNDVVRNIPNHNNIIRNNQNNNNINANNHNINNNNQNNPNNNHNNPNNNQNININNKNNPNNNQKITKILDSPRLTWDDDFPQVFNNDWSRRQSNGNVRTFSNAHSGPSQAKPIELLKTTIDAIVAGRDVPIVPISEINQNGNYRHADGGGVEKFYGIDRVIEGPNSITRNQQRSYERNVNFNSDIGYNRNNQWSTNTLRRLDAQGSKPGFSKDFIDVFRDEY